jgi:hypothetical protein
MTPPPATSPARRERRKQDLLLASALARHQAIVAIDQMSPRVDSVANVYLQLRRWVLTPQVLPVAGVLASTAALVALRRVRKIQLVQWGLVGWRVAGLVTGLLGARRG